VCQDPGWNNDVIDWCAKEAKEPQDYWGGFIIDKMKIQVSN
jgi:hypothetical protein